MTAVMTGLKFDVRRLPNGEGEVYALTADGEARIAELRWLGAEWVFWPCDQSGCVLGSLDSEWRTIDVDPVRRLHLNEIEIANAKSRAEPDTNDTVQAALDLALDTRRRQFRDESWEDAILGAKLFARGWYPKWRAL